MAIRHLMAITALGLVMVTAALVPLRSYLHPLRAPKGWLPPVSQARQHLGDVERDLVVARLRDSLWHGFDNDAPITVQVDQQIPAHAATAIRSSLVERWASVIRKGGPPLIIALLVSEYQVLRNSTVYLLPETDTDPCIVLDPLSQYQVERSIRTRLPSFMEWLETAVPGPCGFFATFGMPSNSVRTWMERSDYMLAMRTNWGSGPDDIQRRAWDRFPLERRWSLALRACTAGNQEVCASLAGVTEPDSAMQRSIFLTPSRSRSQRSFLSNATYASQYSSLDLGITTRYFLSDLVREFGEERFEQFWTADSPVDEAFRAAFGLSIVDWIQQWAVSQFGEARNGPAVPLPSYVLGFVLSLMFVSGGTWWATRRQVR